MGRAFHHLGVYTYNNFIARATWGLYPREWNPRVYGQYIHYRYYGTNTVRFYVTDGPLTVRGRSAPVKKTTNAADEIARTKFELLEPVSVVDMPRAQQRFARQLHNFNRTRVQKIFAKNITMIKNGLAGIALVIAIYMYTILVLRKETFLEEIDEEVAIERGEMIIDEQGRLVAVK